MIIKKLVYLYICNYAEQNAELALLAVNTLQNDCKNENPMVRGLALRSMCSLRLSNLVEYIVAPIKRGLSDPSSYVRKTAILGVAKLHQLNAKVFHDGEMVNRLYDMLRDKDTLVVSNALNALTEILREKGGVSVSKAIAYHLLNRMKEFTEWSQVLVLDVVGKYKPETDEEIFDIMNVLDDKLKHPNSSVVLGVTKLFLSLTASIPEVNLMVYDRLRDPLLTLLGSASNELAYATLQHIKLLIDRAPGVFDSHFKHFYCRYNDPSYIKGLKLEILTLISNNQNHVQIVQELLAYVSDVDIDTAQRSIRSIGDLTARLDTIPAQQVITAHLLPLFGLGIDYVTSETLAVMKNLARKYPGVAREILGEVKNCLGSVTTPEARVSVIWIIGEYGALVPEAPYLLEPLVEKYSEEPDHRVRLQLLTSVMRLFFSRPPEVHSILGKLLFAATSDFSHADVHDRALLYFRLLRHSVSEAERVVNCHHAAVDVFAEEEISALKDRLPSLFVAVSDSNSQACLKSSTHSRFSIDSHLSASFIQKSPRTKSQSRSNTLKHHRLPWRLLLR
eukprot:TRINITY_DN1519_c0_g1_i2.p1 TRINITY_DN1519_c0_g1~~TRINITY_DN1519_c0_g1_i2.p1  ORF type:complete len:619 (-),score=155.73 TRINITY_DN1519_c0_g1_i2:573-2258(-)